MHGHRLGTRPAGHSSHRGDLKASQPALDRSADVPVPNDQHALVGQRDADQEFLPNPARLVARVAIETTAACQRQRDSQFSSAGVVHPVENPSPFKYGNT